MLKVGMSFIAGKQIVNKAELHVECQSERFDLQTTRRGIADMLMWSEEMVARDVHLSLS